MPYNSCCNSALPILAWLSQTDPLREQLRNHAGMRGWEILFFDHLYDAVSRAPLCGHQETVILVTRPQLLSPAGITAFRMLFGVDSLRYILWADSTQGIAATMLNACCVQSVEQLDAVVRTLRQPAAKTPPAAVVSYCPAKSAATDYRLTEDELNALLGVKL